mgnify:CR=1 FL=1
MKISGPREGDAILPAVACMCVAMVMLPVLNGSAKLLGQFYPMPEIVWARYAGHFVFMVALFLPKRGLRLFVTARPGLQICRSLLLLCATILFFVALKTIALATAVAINFVGPIMVTALAVPFLGERVGPRRWAAVFVGFAGALIIIRPGTDVAHWSSLLVLGNAACFALYQILSRKISASDSAETSIVYVAMVGLVASSIALPFGVRLPFVWWHWLVFLTLGLSGGLGHYFVVKAYGYAPASIVSPFGYGQLIGATIIGFVAFGDFPDGWTWVGAAVIVGSGLYITYRESRVGRQVAAGVARGSLS